jgi:hypothetical protein
VAYIQQGFTVEDLRVGECTLATADFPGALRITEVSEITNADYSNSWGSLRSFIGRLKQRVVNRIRQTEHGTYAVGVAIGIREDGRAGAWEIHDDCTAYAIRRDAQRQLTTLLPDIRGVERERGWTFRPESIVQNGQFVRGKAVNEAGFVSPQGWTVAAGTEVDVAWKLGTPFFRWVFGVRGTVLCDDLDVVTEQGAYFVRGCGTAPVSAEPLAAPAITQPAVVTEAKAALPYRLYPNPTAAGSVTVEADRPLGTIRILNLNGQLLRTLETESQRTTLEVSDLVSGVYIVEVESRESLERRKLIVD